ncbi:MAG: TonB-dependent receptor [Bacteroidota bacterium]
MKKYIPIFFLFLTGAGFSQVSVSGFIRSKTSEPLPGATIKVFNKDSVFITGASAGMEGEFSFSVQAGHTYLMRIIYLSYTDLFKTIETGSANLSLGTITLKENAQQLSEVEVKTTQTRGEQKGDTTAFNAGAFKTNPDATAEDLLKKMPGVTSDNNGVKVNGETVQKILVDGKPFFGDDPNAALKNLPADIIDKVEVFDKMSDQSQFTGFNDGDQSKTINIVTKKGKNVGQFGRIYGGYGTDERYNAGAVLNSFNAKRRASLLLLSNNINQQNFSLSDITGAMGSTGGNNRGGGQPGGGRQGGSSALMTSPQNGNTTTQSAGINYSDEWGKKISVSGSYFFNYTDNKNHSDIRRNYFTDDRLTYTQVNDDRNVNQNHRANLRLEYSIDSSNKLILTPSLSFQNNEARSSIVANNTILDNVFKGSTNTRSDIVNKGFDFSNNALYQHKFNKQGRTISLNVTTQLSERSNEGNYLSKNVYSDTLGSTLDQHFSTNGDTKKISGNLSYTEPLSKLSQLQISYMPSYTEGGSDKRTYDYDTSAMAYTDFNTPLSNKYSNVYLTQKGGLSYRYRKDKLNFSFGADGQLSTLTGNQTFPVAFQLDQSFRNILPNAMLNYKFNKTKNLRVYYRTNTNIPSISQLQNVVDISNPLQIKSGNAALKQTFENNLNVRFGGFNPQTSRNAMLFVNANYTDNYISNATYILQNDSIIQGYQARSGSQLTKPVNLDNYYSIRGFFVYGFPVSAIKSNLNFNGGVTYNHTPAILNNLLNYSNSYATNAGAFIGSNISDKLDFSLGYNGNYTIVKNTVQKKSDNNYFSHAATFKINWLFLKGFVINTDVTHTLYNGLTQNFNQEYLLWNAYLGYKFLKNKSLEAKVSVFDILNQNRSVGRNVTGSYTEDYNTVVLKRYFMFTLTYTFKNFKSGSLPPKTEDNQNGVPNGPPPGMQRPPGSGGY